MVSPQTMPNLAATVILYHPDTEQVIRNIQSYSKFVRYLIVIVNSRLDDTEKKQVELHFPGCRIIQNDKNKGIAKALNQAADEALSNGYEWLLTMDQDSSFTDGRFFQRFNDAGKYEIAIFAPETSDATPDNKQNIEDETPLTVITSGSIINLKNWKEIGGFNEKLFIDEVDHDFCLRSHLNGQRILKFTNVRMNHHLGNLKIVGFAGKKNMVYWHKPARTYFIVRNNLYMFSAYAERFPDYIQKRKKILIADMIKTLLFGTEKVRQLKAIIRAYTHYRKGIWVLPENL